MLSGVSALRKVASLLGVALLSTIALTASLAVTAEPDRSTGKQAASGQVAPVDLNKATEEELTKVPGIGPSLAKRIVEFRSEHGPFGKVDDILKVRGIGEKSFQKLRPYLKVESGN